MDTAVLVLFQGEMVEKVTKVRRVDGSHRSINLDAAVIIEPL